MKFLLSRRRFCGKIVNEFKFFAVEMSSRLQIVDCENGKRNNKPIKKQYDRTGHETGGGGNGHVQTDHPTS